MADRFPLLPLLVMGLMLCPTRGALARPAQTPPPPPPTADQTAVLPPIAADPSDELIDHHDDKAVRVIEPEAPSGPWLTATGDCAALLRSGKIRKALACAGVTDAAVAARATERLAEYDAAGKLWRSRRAKLTGEMSLEVMRRANAMAELELSVAALVAGSARSAVRHAKSAQQTTLRQAANPAFNLRHPAAISLQLGLAWRARRRKKQARAAFARAKKGRESWVAIRAGVFLNRLSNRTLRKGPWPLVERAYGGPGEDMINAVTRLKGGDLMLAGRRSERGKAAAQLAVWRTDATGRTRWLKVFGRDGHDEAHGLIALGDGSVVAIGETADSDKGSEILVVRIGADATVMWHKRFGGPGFDRGTSIIQRPDGELWAATTNRAGTPEADIRLLRLSSNGKESQLQPLRSGGEDQAVAIVRRGKGVLLAGSGRANAGAPWEGRIIALGERSQVLWKKPVRFADGCKIAAVAVDRKGGTIAAGSAWVAGSKPRIFVASLAQGGRTKWIRSDKRLNNATVSGLVLTGRSHVALLAIGKRPGHQASAWLLGYRGKRPRWSAPIGGDAMSVGGALISAGKYGLVAVGGVRDRGRGFSDGWLVRTGR